MKRDPPNPPRPPRGLGWPWDGPGALGRARYFGQLNPCAGKYMLATIENPVGTFALQPNVLDTINTPKNG